MCGIAGIISQEKKLRDATIIKKMADSIHHRGPDDEGYFISRARDIDYVLLGGKDTPQHVWQSKFFYTPAELTERFAGTSRGFDVFLANRRLAIIDLSAAGHQPMVSVDGRYWITYNGEIHNFKELRAELEALGHTFVSESDTEIILKAYEVYGKECLHRFNGMWAFAIWDRKERKLFASRDRFGIKPFYYFCDGKTFVFASEIKALLASGAIKPEPNDAAVYEYLAYGESDHREETFFRGIRQLLGGYSLEFNQASGVLRIERYYGIPQGTIRLTQEQYAERFLELFEDSIRLRLISDVPVGTCLSGGLDSSSIVCMVDQFMRTQGLKLPGSTLQKTFSARYSDTRHDEGEYIKAVTTQTAVQPYEVYPEPKGFLENLQKLVWHQDEPFGSTSAYAQWSVFKTVREAGVAVTLDGQGGDETMGGYHHYFGPYFADLFRRLKFISLFGEISAYRTLHGYSAGEMLRRIVPNFLPAGLRNQLRPVKSPAWVNRDAVERLHLPRTPYRESFTRQRYLDTMLFLHALLRFEDKNSMAHSVESRLPFLDHRLVEFSFQIPEEYLIHNGTTKQILREAMRGILPEKVRTRQDKIGFSTPEDEWFRNELRAFTEEIIRSKSFCERPYFVESKIGIAFESHINRQKNISQEIWRCLNLELWLRHFID